MSSRFKEIAKKKTNILSKILGVDYKSPKSPKSRSAPDTHVIAKIQERINNPLFELSIADYELMCDNNMLTKMMSKVLECEEKQLKKFCKYINVFKDNINSSPKSIKNKMKPIKNRGSLNELPDELLVKILDKYKSLFPIKYTLRDWIPHDKLNYDMLSKNPNAVDFLIENKIKLNWAHLSENTNPKAIELLEANPDEIYWEQLSANPSAIKLLKANKDNIRLIQLSENPNAIELLRERIDIENKSTNLRWGERICWVTLSANPNAIELLEDNLQKIDLANLSTNPNAIQLLKANKDIIDWPELSRNPNAIELLAEKIEEEKEMDRLHYTKRIDWGMLSMNPNAIELLKENMGKINWEMLSKNPNPKAIELLKANPKKIDWEYLSANPSAIELLEEKMKKEIEMSDAEYKKLDLKNKIRLTTFSSNPAIFEAK